MDWLGRAWTPLFSERPGETFRQLPQGVYTSEEALTLSSFHASLWLYQRLLGSSPLITYRRQDQGRERDRTNPAYPILHERPNPAQSRHIFFEFVVKELFTEGEAFINVVKDGN